MTPNWPTHLPANGLMSAPIHSHHFSAILTVAPPVHAWTAPDFLQVVKHCVATAGLTTVNETTFTFQPQGISVVVLLAESHVAVHFWPEVGKVTIDLHVCDFSQHNLAKAQTLTDLLSAALGDRTHAPVWHYRLITG
jgi:S-adenosylmethionine decarboxylase